MKKKQTIPLFLALTMVMQSTPYVFAQENKNTGDMSIDINLEMPSSENNFLVKLSALNGSDVITDEFSTVVDNKVKGKIENIPVGKYKLEISAKNYVTYEDEVEITPYNLTLSLNNSQMVNNNIEDKFKQGVMAVGDINGDNTIDENDKDLMFNAIDSNEYNADYDLNGDGKLNIADLTYITLNYGANVIAKPLYIIPTDTFDSINVNTDATITNGKSLKDLVEKKTGYVQFGLTNGGKISSDTPVTIDISVADNSIANMANAIVITPPANSNNIITDAKIIVEDTDGNTYEAEVVGYNENLADSGDLYNVRTAAVGTKVDTTVESDGTIIVNIGRQIAVKKVTINITGSSSELLVDIATVEFLNNLQDRIPEPELNIPTITKIEQIGSESFSVEWKPQVNVAGYNVAVECEGKEQYYSTATPNIIISDFDGKLKTYKTYSVKVQSVNGNWKSPFSDSTSIELIPTSLPPAPEYVKAEGKPESINVSWREMKDTQGYNLYYKEDSETEYTEILGITTTSYTIANLEPSKKYQVYVVGYNHLGNSPASQINEAVVLESKPVQMPKYKLINTSNGTGVKTSHISSVQYFTQGGSVENEFDIVYDNQSTYLSSGSWDIGGFNWDGGGYGPIITLDSKQEINTIRFAPSASQPHGYSYIRAYYWDENGNKVKVIDNQKGIGVIQRKQDSNKNLYYELTFDKPVKADKFQINLANYLASAKGITIAEVNFYYYDSIIDDIANMFTDSSRIALKPDVTEQTIKDFENRANTVDSVSGEYHPNREAILKDLEYARALLGQTGLNDVIVVNPSVTSRADGHTDFAMSLTNYQPLGLTAKAGDTLVIYVGSSNGDKEGTAANLSFFATQQHAEVSQWSSGGIGLKIGRNEITVPQLSTKTSEQGGSLYVAYTGVQDAKQYSLRISGGEPIPMLDVSKAETDAEKLDLINEYITKLETHVSELETKHAQNHEGYSYDPKECIDNYTDIVMKNMMYSVPATQVLSALGTSDKADRMLNALNAMEQQVKFFYQHKGYNENETGTNKFPSQRLNIRYHTMFTGAFMYAGGKHIGIEYGSVPGLFSMNPVVSSDNGEYISGNYAGWGIAHEIGHVINSSSYAFAEVTNNYFSMLAQSKDTNATARINYDSVYKKVTSNTDGKASNVFTQLAMYWQLHMYYDNYYNYKMFDSYEEQFNNLFFARVDSYVRDTSKAPNGLTLDGNSDNNFVRLACAAAEKDLTDFFKAWGVILDQTTIEYASNFDKETKKIQYFNDDARNYKLAGNSGMDSSTSVSAQGNYIDGENYVTISLENNGGDSMLGYEIIRNEKPIAFVSADESSFTDIITTENNRVYKYEVVGYDKLLNTTEKVDAGIFKVSHNGSIGKDRWSIETNMSSDNDEFIPADDDSGYCEDTHISAIKDIIDNNYSNSYDGLAGGDAEFVINLGGAEQITAIKYTAGDGTPISDYEVFISDDNQNWQSVHSGTFSLDSNNSQTVYLTKDNDPRLQIYDTSYVKVVAKQNMVSIAEFDILGPTGDNVDLKNNGIGTLKNDFAYDENNSVQAGSVVITGEYKGNPAYNVVLLRDQNGSLFNMEQIILADVPEEGNLGEVSDGKWLCYMPIEDLDGITSIKAELYRVDDAITLEGQRLVSDTMYVDVPEVLPEIEIQSEVTFDLKEEILEEEILEEEVLEEIEKEENKEEDKENNNNESDIKDNENEGENNEETDNNNENDETNNNGNDEINNDENNKEDDSEQNNNEINNEETNNENEDNENKTDENGGLNDNNENTDNNTNNDETNNNTNDGLNGGLEEVNDEYNSSENTVVSLASNLSVAKAGKVYVSGDTDSDSFTFTPIEYSKKTTSDVTVNFKNKESLIALQTRFNISNNENVKNVNIKWSDVIDNNAVFKNITYNKDTNTVSVYVIAKDNVLYGSSLKLGEISIISSKKGVTTCELSVKTNDTVSVSKDYTVDYSVFDSSSVNLSYEKSGSSSSDDDEDGSYSGGGSSGSGTNNNKDNNKNDTPQQPSKPVETPKEDIVPPSNTAATVDAIFNDINKTDWYYSAVEKAYKNKWFMGTSDKEFSPNAKMTRGMFVTVLGRFANAQGSVDNKFKDVSASMYYAPFVAWANKNGIVNGVSQNEFAPDAPITREQLAVIINQYIKAMNLNIESVNAPVTFSDSAKISSWAAESVSKVQQFGIINGRTDGSFDPQGNATRAEVATILKLLDEKIKK